MQQDFPSPLSPQMSFTASLPFLSWRRLSGLAFACFLLLVADQALAGSVLVVLSETSPVYMNYAQAFRAGMDKRNAATEVAVTDLGQLSGRPLPEATVLVAVGSHAAEAMVQRDLHTPMLLTMLPRENLERILAMQPKVGGVYIDQPASRYIALVRAALPDVDHIGLLVGRDSKATVNRLAVAAREQHLRMRVEAVTSESGVFPPLHRLLSDTGVLIATPDATIFNSQTIPSILISSYRSRVPVIGFSPAYVNAGAVVALYSTPEQLAEQSAELCQQVLAGGPMPAPQFPRQYTIGINDRVARSLGLTLENETVIRERIERQERQP